LQKISLVLNFCEFSYGGQARVRGENIASGHKFAESGTMAATASLLNPPSTFVESLTELLIILILILLNGFFAGAEIAIITSRRNRLEQAAAGGSRGAKTALELSSNANRFLSTVQVGITCVGTLAATYGGLSLVGELANWLNSSRSTFVVQNSQGIALALVTGALAFTSLVLGELVPKRIALAYAERLAAFVAMPMWLLSVVARPFVALIAGATGLVLTILRVKTPDNNQVSIEDIEYLIESGMEQGVLKESEEVALEALQLRNRRVRDVMHPRIDIDAVDIETPSDEVVGAVAMSGFSRLPVYEGDLDHVLGFVYNKDIFQQHYLGRNIELRKILHAPLFVPESLTLDRLLLMFQERRTQLAIVLDEFGGTSGMVTFEDILEELVGEIYDEHRRDVEQRIVRRDEGSWLVDGKLPVHELAENLPDGVQLTSGAADYSTVAGLVMGNLERLPKIGDLVLDGNVRMEVVDMDGTRIDRLLVTAVPSPEQQSENKSASI
jgi:putative hemolysin